MKIDTVSLGPLIIGKMDLANESFTETVLEHSLSKEEVTASQRFKHLLRKREFLAGRFILHSLQPKLAPVLCTDTGAPIWDNTYTGSLSHKNGLVLGCVEPRQMYTSIGIDLEECSHFPKDVESIISFPEELALLNTIFHQNKIFSLALLFSIKESLFKVCHPVCKIWFGFHDAEVLSCDTRTGTFEIKLLKDLSPYFASGQMFKGFFKDLTWGSRSFIVTALVLEADRY